MRRTAVIAAALVLAGCGSSSPTGPEAAAPSSSGSAVTSTPPAGPSFDCAHADGDVQTLICRDPQLARLDRNLADEYQHSLDQPGADRKALQDAQREWQTRRDNCWKADDMRRCVVEAYQTRLVELKINDPDTVAPPTVTYRCPDVHKPLTAQFYNQFDPKAAVLTWGQDRAVVFVERSGSGARYGREGVEFWEHQGTVTVDFYGNKFVCSTP